MKKYYYAIKSGRKTGIFDTWDECKKNVIGYKGAIYKKFENIEDAKEFINIDVKDTSIETEIKNNTAIAFTDGSFSDSSISYGLYIEYCINKKLFFYKESQRFNDSKEIKSRNVSGELFAVQRSIEFAISKSLKSIIIYYDYTGIEHWANGTWKCNLELTKNYANFIKEKRNDIEINFVKVKAHSGVEYNELVDRLAKSATFDLFSENGEI